MTSVLSTCSVIFEKNWRRMDLEKIMKGMLKKLSNVVDEQLYEDYEYMHRNIYSESAEFSEPCDIWCKKIFYGGQLMHCVCEKVGP